MKTTATQMVNTLIAAGYSETGIAGRVKTTQVTIHRIKHGTDPRYSLGKRIEGLYEVSNQAECVLENQLAFENFENRKC